MLCFLFFVKECSEKKIQFKFIVEINKKFLRLVIYGSFNLPAELIQLGSNNWTNVMALRFEDLRLARDCRKVTTHKTRRWSMSEGKSNPNDFLAVKCERASASESKDYFVIHIQS